MKNSIQPSISAIIPTYNEEPFIRSCLESLKNLDYPKERYEIIIVDNGSTDKTVSICRNHVSKVYVRPHLTIGALRNYGTKNASGEIYAFIDADCTADRDWLRSAVESLGVEKCVTGSKYRISHNAKWIERSWYSGGVLGRHEVSYINSGNLIVPSNIFVNVGGFNETLVTGEDYEFCLRASKLVKIISDDRIIVTHLGNPKTLRQFFEREIWHGLGAFGTIKDKWLDKPLIGTLIFFFFTILQICGLGSLLILKSGVLFLFASLGIVFLLLVTITNRIKSSSSKLPFMQKIQLSVLYYLFYLARGISIGCLMQGRTYHRSK